VALGHKIAAAADEDKVVIIIANDGNQATRRLIAHQLVAIRDTWQTVWRRSPVVPQIHASRGVDAQTLATAHDQAGVGPTVAGVIGPHAGVEDRKSTRLNSS